MYFIHYDLFKKANILVKLISNAYIFLLLSVTQSINQKQLRSLGVTHHKISADIHTQLTHQNCTALCWWTSIIVAESGRTIANSSQNKQKKKIEPHSTPSAHKSQKWWIMWVPRDEPRDLEINYSHPREPSFTPTRWCQQALPLIFVYIQARPTVLATRGRSTGGFSHRCTQGWL